MIPGATIEATSSNHVGIVSLGTYGYCIDRSTRENGRLYGSVSAKPPPIAAMAL